MLGLVELKLQVAGSRLRVPLIELLNLLMAEIRGAIFIKLGLAPTIDMIFFITVPCLLSQAIVYQGLQMYG